jgi:hypothetical protein
MLPALLGLDCLGESGTQLEFMKTNLKKLNSMGQKSLFSFNRFLRQAPFHALLVFCLLVVTLMKADAQAPSSVAGRTFSVQVTSGEYPPFASDGYYLFLPAVSGHDYQIIGIYGIESSSGTYSYSEAGATGTAQMDDNLGGSLETDLTFDSATLGDYEATSEKYSATQTGNFEMFSAPVPSSLPGKQFTCSIEAGAAPFANAGSFIFEAATSGRTYAMTGDGTNTASSTGTYSYSKINGNTGELKISDSVLGNDTIYFAFNSGTNGGFAIKSASTDGYQIGHFLETDTGSLQVKIAPAAAITNGAQWQVDGGMLQPSDATITNLPVGDHIVSFTTITNWTTPSNQTVSVRANSTTTAIGTYVAQTGALQVFIKPAQANKAGAKWQVQGTAFHTNGAIVTDLTPGDKTVSFTSIPGWLAPLDQTVTISIDQTNATTGFYVDITPPTLAIVSPRSGQSVSNAAFTLSGAANDNVAVGAVYVQLGGGTWTNAASTNGFTNWSAGAILAPGSNTVRAYAVDTSSNVSSTNKVTFRYIPSATVIVQTNGRGGINPVDNGELLAIGTNYTLTATPGRNWIFSNWVVTGSQSFVSNSPVLRFTMRSNLVLTANFVTNVFLAAQGTYNGLFAPAGAPREQTNSGSFTFTLTTNGVLSGKLTIGTNTPVLSGQFNPAGAVSIVTPRTGLSTLTTTLQLGFTNQTVQGSVGDGSFLASLSGDRAVFSSSHPATNFAGQYTFFILGTNRPTVGPFGSSFGTVTVAPGGTITFAGRLADGTVIGPSSSVVLQGGNWPFYVPLYGGAGSLWGEFLFTNQTLTPASPLSWINATNTARTALYRTGFTNPSALMAGSPYNASAQPLLGLTNLVAILHSSNGDVAITNQITLAPNSAITVVPKSQDPENTNKLALTINKRTGAISGTFADPANPRQPDNIYGVLMQNRTNAAGWFIGTNQNGSFTIGQP